MAERNAIQQEFDAFGKGCGMKKHSGSWYKSSDEVVTVVNLQKSQYALSYYIDIGFWVKALGEEQFPQEHKCHVRFRLESLVPDRSEEVAALLDLGNGLPMPGQIAALHELLQENVQPLLDSATSVDGLRRLQRDGTLTRAFVRSQAIPLLRDG